MTSPVKTFIAIVLATFAVSCGGSGGGGNSTPSITVVYGRPSDSKIAIVNGASSQIQVGQVDSPTSQASGAIFSGNFTNPIRFDLAGFDQVWLNATDGVQEVGGGFLTGAIFPNDDDFPYRALVFNGTAASGVDLTPAGTYSAFANTVAGGLQGGWTKDVHGGMLHPVIWSGSASSIVNLLPPSADSGSVRGIKSGMEAGRVHLIGMPDGTGHAAIWKGTAASFVDKNPTGYQS